MMGTLGYINEADDVDLYKIISELEFASTDPDAEMDRCFET